MSRQARFLDHEHRRVAGDELDQEHLEHHLVQEHDAELYGLFMPRAGAAELARWHDKQHTKGAVR